MWHALAILWLVRSRGSEKAPKGVSPQVTLGHEWPQLALKKGLLFMHPGRGPRCALVATETPVEINGQGPTTSRSASARPETPSAPRSATCPRRRLRAARREPERGEWNGRVFLESSLPTSASTASAI